MTSLRRTTIATPKYNTQRLTLSQVNSQTVKARVKAQKSDEKLGTEDEEFGQDTGSECEDNVEKRYMQLVNTYTSHVNYILGTF